MLIIHLKNCYKSIYFPNPLKINIHATRKENNSICIIIIIVTYFIHKMKSLSFGEEQNCKCLKTKFSGKHLDQIGMGSGI